MTLGSLPASGALSATTRLRVGVLAGSTKAEALVLLALGAAAAYLTLAVDLDLHTPGHAILRCVGPLALGLALVPRRFAGTVMGGAALVTVLLAGLARGAPGWGSATSLVLCGPILDFAVRNARSGLAVYVALVLGGLGANLVAFGVRLTAKALFADGSSPIATWWPRALISYPLCGVAAGLVSAMLWFRFRARTGDGDA